jgi:hypothetical protein
MAKANQKVRKSISQDRQAVAKTFDHKESFSFSVTKNGENLTFNDASSESDGKWRLKVLNNWCAQKPGESGQARLERIAAVLATANSILDLVKIVQLKNEPVIEAAV